MELDPDVCYAALSSRDRRFDGRFFTGVVTTGLYCRPVCPARTPRRRNVKFFPCAAAAEEAGFRPCLRCRPETAPGSPAWLGATATLVRAFRLIDEGALDQGSVEELAARLGIGSRYLRRLFAGQLGASPLAVARTRRVHFARRLLDETRLPITEVAFASGFRSLRRFNAAMLATFRRPPRVLRSSRGAGRPGPPGDRGIVLRLPARPPFEPSDLLEFLARRAIPGVESVADGTYARTFEISGVAGVLRARRIPGEDALELRIESQERLDLLPIAARAARIFDLDADAARIAAHLRRDPVLATALRGRRGIRVPGAWDSFELGVRAILGQQVTVAGARTLAGRIVERFGRPLPGADSRGDSPTRLFPRPGDLAVAPLESAGMPRARAESIRTLARAVVEGAVNLDAPGGLERAVESLTALPGIGDWTAHYIAMRALGEPDAFPAGDLGLRRAFAQRGRLPDERALVARAEAWRPWRAYATFLVWTTDLASPAIHRRAAKPSITRTQRRAS